MSPKPQKGILKGLGNVSQTLKGYIKRLRNDFALENKDLDESKMMGIKRLKRVTKRTIEKKRVKQKKIRVMKGTKYYNAIEWNEESERLNRLR